MEAFFGAASKLGQRAEIPEKTFSPEIFKISLFNKVLNQNTTPIPERTRVYPLSEYL